MNFKITALIDAETRKEIRELILSEGRALARELVSATMSDEVKRIVGALNQKAVQNPWQMQGIFRDAISNMIKNQWGEVGERIQQAIDDAAEKKVAAMLKNKTVWEAESQHEYVRKLIRQELRSMFSDKP